MGQHKRNKPRRPPVQLGRAVMNERHLVALGFAVQMADIAAVHVLREPDGEIARNIRRVYAEDGDDPTDVAALLPGIMQEAGLAFEAFRLAAGLEDLPTLDIGNYGNYGVDPAPAATWAVVLPRARAQALLDAERELHDLRDELRQRGVEEDLQT